MTATTALTTRLTKYRERRERRRHEKTKLTLLEHLAELRRRLLLSLAGVIVAAVITWFQYEQVIILIARPLTADQALNFVSVGAAFDLKLRVSLAGGTLLAAPWWLFQCWCYIAPGLTRRERRHLLGFALSGVILIHAGSLLGIWTAPRAVRILASFAPENTLSLFSAGSYVSFYLRLVLVFALSALAPLVLVAANYLGIIRARTLAEKWRWATMAAFTFAAIANPLPEPWSMIFQALILLAVYALGVGICFLRERRQANGKNTEH